MLLIKKIVARFLYICPIFKYKKENNIIEFVITKAKKKVVGAKNKLKAL